MLEIDLSRVTYFGSDGGTVFFMVLRAARESGTRVIATHAGQQPLSALRQLGLERLCDLYAGPGSDSGHDVAQ